MKSKLNVSNSREFVLSTLDKEPNKFWDKSFNKEDNDHNDNILAERFKTIEEEDENVLYTTNRAEFDK